MQLLVNIDVANLEEAIAFYEQGVGLRLARLLFGGTVAEMLGGSSLIYLVAKAVGTSPSAHTSQLRDYHRHWTPVHLDFVVSDIDSAVERAVAAGAKLEGVPQSFVWGRLSTMSDPFGHGLCFVQWIGRGYAELEQHATPDNLVNRPL
jgi:predicted enzyme related to lactoylglutathione lyase